MFRIVITGVDSVSSVWFELTANEMLVPFTALGAPLTTLGTTVPIIRSEFIGNVIGLLGRKSVTVCGAVAVA